MNLKRLLALILAFALVAAACGDDDDGTAEEPDSAPTATSSSDDSAPEPTASGDGGASDDDTAPSSDTSASDDTGTSDDSGASGTAGLTGDAWFAAAAAPYAGITIRGISESTPPSNYAAENLAAQFEEVTGITVELETTDWGSMRENALRDMDAGTGIYDFIYIEQDIVYADLARNFLVSVTGALRDNPDLASPDFSESDFTTFAQNFVNPDDGELYAVPMEAFIKPYLYRTDLFEDPAIKAAFQSEYGYPLAPATTFDQYNDISEFFTAYGEENGLELWGTTVQATTSHVASFYEFFESVAPTRGVYNWGITDDYKADVANGGAMNSSAAVAALAYWVGLVKNAPPESTSSTWDEVASTFAAGRAAQGLVYGENAAWIATDSDRSSVVGNVGVALPPVANGVMADAESGAGYIGYFDGGAFAIPVSSNNHEATLLWLQYIGQPSVQPEWAAAGARVVHDATYDAPEVIAQDQATNGYYTLMREQGRLFRGAPEFPFHAQVRDVIAPFIWDAILGNITAREALDGAAKAAEEELVNLGYG